MPSIRVDVDIDLDEIDTDELIEELEIRVEKWKKNKDQTKKIEQIVSDCEYLLDMLGGALTKSNIPSSTLEDKIKIEHLQSVWNKYTASEIEQRLP